jgi:hypothetical protein
MAFPAVQAFAAPGYQNVYLPGYMGDGEARNMLLVGFPFNEESWALPNYVTVIGQDKPKFFYARWYGADFLRRPHAGSLDRAWADGAERPRAQVGPRHIFQAVEMHRFSESDVVGDMAEEFSDIGSLIKIKQETLAGECMIDRTIQTQAKILTSGNWQSSPAHYYAKYGVLANAAVTLGYSTGYFGVAGVDNVSGGTINDPFISNLFSHAINTISLESNARVKPQDLVAVMNPITASRLAKTQEIRAYMAQQSGSLDVLQGKNPAFWPAFGLPNPLYGVKILVDYTPKVTTKVDNINEDTKVYAVQNGAIEFLARPGGVVGMASSRSFSTVCIFQHEKDAMKPETIPDVRSRRTEVMLTDFYVPEIAAPETGFVVADVFDPATS